MKRRVRPFFLLILAAAIFFLNRRYGWSTYLADRRALELLRAAVEENHWRASLLYVAATVAGSVLLALPGLTFAIAAGALFGPAEGTLLCLFAATLGASLSFLAGRYFLRDAVKPFIEKNRLLKKILFDDAGRSGMALLMITRLLPVFPYNLQNFAYGATDIGFWPYTIYTFVFLFPGVAFFTVGAAGFAIRENRWACFAAAGAFAVVVASMGLYMRGRYLKTETSKTTL